MSFAYARRLSALQLVALLKGLEEGFGLAIIESVVDVRFVSVARPPDDFRFANGFDPFEWERGRAFGEQMELRWRRRKEEFQSLVLSETPLALSTEVEEQTGGLGEARFLERVDALEVRLWGEWQDPNEETDLSGSDRHWWYEERIPRFLSYPWNDRDRWLSLVVARYREALQVASENSPSDFLYRFVGLRSTSLRSDAG